MIIIHSSQCEYPHRYQTVRVVLGGTVACFVILYAPFLLFCTDYHLTNGSGVEPTIQQPSLTFDISLQVIRLRFAWSILARSPSAWAWWMPWFCNNQTHCFISRIRYVVPAVPDGSNTSSITTFAFSNPSFRLLTWSSHRLISS